MPALQIARRLHRTTVLRQFLIAAQVAASCVLLIVAGLLGRALEHAMSAHPGFEYERVIAIDPWPNDDSTIGISSSGMPGPLSRIERYWPPPFDHATVTAISPPFGFGLFVMKAVAPPGTTMMDVYRATIPFLLLNAVVMLIMILVPSTVLWLPSIAIK